MDDLISRLSELRCQYNCFDENERDAYHTLSEAIKALSDVPDTNVGDMISRQEAIDVLEKRLQANGYSNVALVSELNRSIGYLMRLPSADVVEVVRCADCKYWDAFDIHSTICPNHRRCKGIIGKMYTAPDYYCAYGERKDG